MRGHVNKAPRTSGEDRRRFRGVALVVGLIACSAVVWQSSHSSFSGTTTNNGNEMGAGTVTITDNRSGTAVIAATAMAPGATAQVACIGVKYTGSLAPSAIKVYNDQTVAQERDTAAGSYITWVNTAASAMDDFTNFKIEINDTDVPNPPSTPTDCTPTGFIGGWTATPVLASSVGSLKSFIYTDKDWGSGLSSQWGTITANQWRIFRFTYQLDTTATDAAQGDGVKFKVVWEAQS